MKIIMPLLLAVLTAFNLQAQSFQPVNDKSSVNFSIKNFGVKTGGEFKGLAGDITFDNGSPDKAVFDISVDAATVNTDNSARDSHLRKAEYFDAENFPKITFKSEKISSKGKGFTVTGKLTIKGTTKNISFPFTATPKDGGYFFEGSFDINRRDFKVGGNSMVLGDNVTVLLAVFAAKK